MLKTSNNINIWALNKYIYLVLKEVYSIFQGNFFFFTGKQGKNTQITFFLHLITCQHNIINVKTPLVLTCDYHSEDIHSRSQWPLCVVTPK